MGAAVWSNWNATFHPTGCTCQSGPLESLSQVLPHVQHDCFPKSIKLLSCGIPRRSSIQSNQPRSLCVAAVVSLIMTNVFCHSGSTRLAFRNFFGIRRTSKGLQTEQLNKNRLKFSTKAFIRSTIYKYSLRHRKCGVRGFIHELFVSKTRTSEERASEGF